MAEKDAGSQPKEIRQKNEERQSTELDKAGLSTWNKYMNSLLVNAFLQQKKTGMLIRI